MLQRLILALMAGGWMLAQVATQVQTQGDPHPQAYTDSDAYDVYAAVLPNEWTWRAAHATRLIIRGETVSYEMCLSPDAGWRALVGPAIDNFVKVNRKRWLLMRDLTIAKPYFLVPGEELMKPFQTAGLRGWDEISKAYPNSSGWIELSAVGFNARKTVAVVYTSHHCGSLCGGGQFSVMQKKEGKWQPLEWEGGSCAWAS